MKQILILDVNELLKFINYGLDMRIEAEFELCCLH